MAPGFTIAEVRFRGEKVDDAVVHFAPGLSVVAGPSNTGKSLIRSAINFVFGSGEPMKTVEEGAPYGTILVEVRTPDGAPITFERAWNGGDIRRYDVAAQHVEASIPATVLGAKHSADSQENISAVLLNLAGLAGARLRKNATGELRNLSFRDLVEYTLVSEERIITELSPIHSGNVIDKTFESSLFRFLLTGKDDKDVIIAPSKKEEKARVAGQEEALERIKADLTSRIPQDGRTETDLREMAQKIDDRIAAQSRILQNYRTDLAGLEKQRRDLELEHQQSLARLTQVDANIQRFNLLNQQYESDLKRLQSTVEAGILLADHQEGPWGALDAREQFFRCLVRPSFSPREFCFRRHELATKRLGEDGLGELVNVCRSDFVSRCQSVGERHHRVNASDDFLLLLDRRQGYGPVLEQWGFYSSRTVGGLFHFEEYLARDVFGRDEEVLAHRRHLRQKCLHVLIECDDAVRDGCGEGMVENHPSGYKEDGPHGYFSGGGGGEGCWGDVVLGIGYPVSFHVLWAHPRNLAAPERRVLF